MLCTKLWNGFELIGLVMLNNAMLFKQNNITKATSYRLVGFYVV